MTYFLETEDLSFTYPDRTCALKGVNFRIQKGEFVGVLGANGSGKTTLLRMLNGLLKPASGKVYLEGLDLRTIDKDVLFRKVCTMFQNPDDQLFAPTVAQDIAFGPNNMDLSEEEVKRRVDCALDSVGCLELRDKTISALSFGQKKRVCLAGVLAMGPEAILLDEPTSSLDPIGANSIMHLLRDLNKEKAISMVMTTHSVELVPLFTDRVVILSKGEIVREGTPEEVFSEPEIIRDAKLRLPQVGHLFEILKKRDGFDIDRLPLTIGEARREVVSWSTPRSRVGNG